MKDRLMAMQSAVQARLLGTSIVRDVFSGSVTREHYVAYLTDVYSYALHSAQVIGLAASRLVLSNPPLSAYLFRHAQEEMGHDAWAASDLVDLGVSESALSELEPSSACLRMIGLEYYYAAHANPVGLFGWMFMLETLGGTVGGKIGEQLDRVLKLEGRALRFLGGHADADAHHARDLFDMIEAHVRDPADLRVFERMADESAALYCAILDAASGPR